MKNITSIVVILISVIASTTAQAQIPDPEGPVVISPEVTADDHITFRIRAPKATRVMVYSTDILGVESPVNEMLKNPEGIWEMH